MPLDLSMIQNTEKNRLFEVANNSGIPLSSFRISDEGNIFIIEIIDTPLKFIVERSKTDFRRLDYKSSIFMPGFPVSTSSISFDIAGLSTKFELWLKEVVNKYIELANIPNQWGEFQIIQPFISSGSFTENDFKMFNESEKEHIRKALSEFQRSVAELLSEEISPVKESIRQMQERLDYLVNALDRLNRFDWKGVAVSTAIGMATNLTLDTDTGRKILELFRQAFIQVIRFLPL